MFSVAFAYVGILTGAGLATGREILQYFVSFGAPGVLGLVAITILHMLFAKWILALGSYYQTGHHMEALRAIAPNWLARLLDWSLVFACFVMSFVLVAGAGANLEQQFGIAPWLGSLICAVAILAISYMDFDKVMAALGMFTPIILVMLVIGLIHILLGPSIDWSAQFAYAATVPTTLDNIYVSVINYFALCLMSATSMLFVLGGSIIEIENAETGGLMGGFLTGIVSALCSFLMYAKIDTIAATEVPMLSFMNSIHPILGFVMAIVIYGMIFNSGISVCYSMAKRAANGNRRLFHIVIAVIVIIAYALSFVGFSQLVALMYPVLGYVGLLLFVTIIVAWWRHRRQVQSEKHLRQAIFQAVTQNDDSFAAKPHTSLRELMVKSTLSQPAIEYWQKLSQK